MSDNQQLTIKTLVWGKVGQYPWWPGKIIQKFQQNHLPVYKVSFFGDSSYSFLHEAHIIPYQHFDFDLNTEFEQDFKLQKAISQARIIYQKKKLSERLTDEETPSPKLQIYSLAENNDNIHETEGLVQPEERQSRVEGQVQKSNQESSIIDFLNTEITHENVIDMIEISSLAFNNEKSSSKKKDIFKFRQKLKKTLLLKYNFKNIFVNKDKQFENGREIKMLSNFEKRDKMIKNMPLLNRFQKKNKAKLTIKEQKINAIKMIFKNLRKNNIQIHLAKQISMQIVNKIEDATYGNSENFKKKAILILKRSMEKMLSDQIPFTESFYETLLS